MSYPVEYFVRKFGFYFYYTWNSDSEQDADPTYSFLLIKYTDLFYLLLWFIFINFSSDGMSPLAAMHL